MGRLISSKQTDSAYGAFLNKFTSLYDKTFEKFAVTLKSKTLKNPWIIKGILKSSKTKQRRYDKFWKSKTYEHEISYKNSRKLFESIKQRAKSQYYSKMILHYKDNIKKLGKLWRKWLAKANLSITHYQNISFSTIGIFLIKKPLPIASMNILSMLDRN